MEWRRAISKKDEGEVGRVYYLNSQIIFREHDCEWTKPHPFTLNPEYGKSIEDMLKASTLIPKQFKEDLLKKRMSEAKLDNGNTLKFWISTYPAPDNWGILPKKTNNLITL